jgi:dipeptidyl aminopeptidase/acylaminoacyl peptidase
VLPDDVYGLRWASDPRVSPDGSSVAVVENWIDRDANEYRSAIWLVACDGSGPPRRFTSGQRADAEPRWSPDGTRLAFVSNRERERKQLYVIPVAGGEPLRLTDLPENVTEVAWSPDGTRLAFVSRVPDPAYEERDERRRPPRRFTRLAYKLDDVGWIGDRRSHLFVVPADGSEPPRQLTDGDFEDDGASWSPDGERLAFSSARHDRWDVGDHRDLFVVAAAGGEPERLTDGDAWVAAPEWSPDGSSIACRWRRGGLDLPQHDQIASVDVATGATRVLTRSLDRNCGSYPSPRGPAWDGATIVFPIEDRGNTHLYRVAADASSEPELVVGGELRVTGYDLAAGSLAYTATTATSPTELFVDGKPLTDFARAFVDAVRPGEPERFTVRSPDGAEVDAWILRPRDFDAGGRYPVLLTIHGGPFSQYGSGFFDEVQVYARAGYAVVYANPRGSSGYSEEWGRAIRGPGEAGPGWGTLDYEDLMAVVDEALARYPFCDGERLGVLGGSYGGFMTSWIVGHTDRFKAALSERAVNNLLSEFGSSDINWFTKAYAGVFPWEDVQAYLSMSPSTYAHDITTPVLILHSENDLRCNIEQGEHLFAILRFLGREVEMVRFPGEGHELTRSGSPLHRVQRFELVLDWFGRHLGAVEPLAQPRARSSE